MTIKGQNAFSIGINEKVRNRLNALNTIKESSGKRPDPDMWSVDQGDLGTFLGQFEAI